MEKFDKMSETTVEGTFAKNENYMDAIKANSGRYKVQESILPIQIMELPFMQKK
jgi:hypothetical protein